MIRGKRFSNTKINAAWASHPSRIACGRLAALSPHHAVRRLLKPRSRRNARLWARSPSRDSADKVRVPWLAVIAQADGSILPVGRIFEEAATPGCPQNAPSGILPRHVPRNPPAVHPREPPETPALLQSNSALKTSHICTGGTLLEVQKHCNRKSLPGCAQTVDYGTSLWKPKEKRNRIGYDALIKCEFQLARTGVMPAPTF